MKRLICEPYVEPVFEVLLGSCWETSVEYSRFLEVFFGVLEEGGEGDFALRPFLLEGAILGFAEDVVGYALILQNSVEIKALGLANRKIAS